MHKAVLPFTSAHRWLCAARSRFANNASIPCLAGLLLAAQLGAAAAQEVLPDFYKEPGVSPNRAYVNQSFNEHIDPFTGALQLHYVDLHLPGNGGFDLSVVRSYSSSSVDTLNPARHEGIAGVGWTVHFGRVLRKDTFLCNAGATVANNPVLELPDGSRQLLAFDAASLAFVTTQRWKAECIAGNMAVYSPDGTRYDMTQVVDVGSGTSPMYAWYTRRITDRNGNSATINYAASGSSQISSVVASDGRRIDFTYFGSGTASKRISSIAAAGQTYGYSYTAVTGVADKYYLSTVTRPGGTSWDYSYNGSLNGAAGGHLLNQVRYPEGGTISYTFGEVYFDTQANPGSRSSVIKTKSVSTGSYWTFDYAPGAPNVYDVTTVNTPSGKITYRHIGPNYAGSGTMWMVGLLMSRQIGSVLTETNVWGKQKISSQNNFRPGAFVLKVDTGEVNAPVLSSRTIVRNGATYTNNYNSPDAYGNPTSITESGPNGGNRTRSLSYNINTAKWIVKQVKDESVSGGTSITRSIDGNGNLLSISRDGVTTGHAYDAEGNVSSTLYPRTLTHYYSQYKRGIAQSENQPEGVSIARAVSDAGNVMSETNGEMKTTSYSYDGLNRLTGISPPIGNAVSISYTATSKTATRGSLTETTSYDSFGRPSSITLGGISRTYRHDALGRMTFASNPSSPSGTAYLHDMLDRVTRVTHADSNYRAISYGAGSKTVNDERFNATTYTYRSYGDPSYELLMSVSAPVSAANVSIGRDGRDHVTSLTQAGISRNMYYNSAGYLTSVINPETGTTNYGRDAAGNMTSRSVGSSSVTGYTYDGQNRLATVTYPLASQAVMHDYTRTHKLKSVASAAASRGYSYDNNDNLEAEAVIVDGRTFSTTYRYNGLDQLSSITYPRSGRIVNYSPNALGRPTQVSGFATNISYWPSGLLQQIDYANGTVSRYGQDSSRLWPSGFNTRDATATQINSSYGYDGTGNLTSISDTADNYYNRGFDYDAIDRLTSARGPWGSGTLAYNGAGNIMSQTQGSFGLSYGYDGQNRLSSVSGHRAGSFKYDANGNVTGAPGATYDYDGAPNLTCVNCADAASRVGYTYDGMNRRVTVSKGTSKTYEVYGFNGNLLLEYTPALSDKQIEYIYLGGRRIAQAQTGGPIEPRATNTTLKATPNPAGVGQIVELRVSIAGNNPTGSVTLRDGATTLGSAVVNAGLASLPVTFSSTGTHSVIADYGGDAANLASTSTPQSVTVNAQADTTTTLVATLGTAVVNQAITLTATVIGNNPGGTVTFFDGSTTVGTVAVSAGRATLQTSFATVGSRSFTASYGGNGSNAPSASAALSVLVNQASTVTTLTPSATFVNTNTTFSLVAVVSGGNATGSVVFRDGSTVIGTVALSGGSATLNALYPDDRTLSLTTAYQGDANNKASTSAVVQVTVSARATIPKNPCITNRRLCV